MSTKPKSRAAQSGAPPAKAAPKVAKVRTTENKPKPADTAGLPYTEEAQAAQVERERKLPNALAATTSSTIARDLLVALKQEFALLRQPWQKMAQREQQDVIDRLRARIESHIDTAVAVLADDGRVAVGGSLQQITIKDGAKCVIVVGKGEPNLHALFDAQGRGVRLVLADAAAHKKGADQVKGDADQRALQLGHEYNDKPNAQGNGVADASAADKGAPSSERISIAADAEEWRLRGEEAARAGSSRDTMPAAISAEFRDAWAAGFDQWHAQQVEFKQAADAAAHT